MASQANNGEQTTQNSAARMTVSRIRSPVMLWEDRPWPGLILNLKRSVSDLDLGPRCGVALRIFAVTSNIGNLPMVRLIRTREAKLQHGFVRARDVTPHHVIQIGDQMAVVKGSSYCNGDNGEPQQLFGAIDDNTKTATAVKIEFENRDPIYVHPAQPFKFL